MENKTIEILVFKNLGETNIKKFGFAVRSIISLVNENYFVLDILILKNFVIVFYKSIYQISIILYWDNYGYLRLKGIIAEYFYTLYSHFFVGEFRPPCLIFSFDTLSSAVFISINFISFSSIRLISSY